MRDGWTHSSLFLSLIREQSHSLPGPQLSGGSLVVLVVVAVVVVVVAVVVVGVGVGDGNVVCDVVSRPLISRSFW